MTRHDLQIKVFEKLDVIEGTIGFQIAAVQPGLVIDPFLRKLRKCKSRAAKFRLIRAEFAKADKRLS